MRITDVELVPEHGTYKVDGSGRIIIPAYMRNKFNIENSDVMDYFTAYVDGRWFMCCAKNDELSAIEQAKKAAEKATKGKK